MKGRKVPFEIDDSLKERRDPFTAEEFWSLREGMTVHVLVAPDERVEGIFKCGHASGSILSVVKGKPYTGFYFEKGYEDSDPIWVAAKEVGRFQQL